MQDTEEVPRSIRFPKSLWEALDNDAKRCKRSSVKQLEALLTVYYELGNVEINEEKMIRSKQKQSPTNDANIIGQPVAPPLEAVKTKRQKTG